MVTVTKLAHVGFRAQNLSSQAEFYNDRMGLERIHEHAGEMFFRADGPDHQVLTLHSAETRGLHHFAVEVGAAEDLGRAAEDLAARGLSIVTSPTTDLDPGLPGPCCFCDPECNPAFIKARDGEPGSQEDAAQPDQWKTVGPSGPGAR